MELFDVVTIVFQPERAVEQIAEAYAEAGAYVEGVAGAGCGGLIPVGEGVAVVVQHVVTPVGVVPVQPEVVPPVPFFYAVLVLYLLYLGLRPFYGGVFYHGIHEYGKGRQLEAFYVVPRLRQVVSRDALFQNGVALFQRFQDFDSLFTRHVFLGAGRQG